MVGDLLGSAVSTEVSEAWLLIATVLTATALVIGVQARLMAQQNRRLDQLEELVRNIEIWRAPWANMPPDMGDATLLTRAIDDHGHQLADILARVQHIEAQLDQWENER